MLTQVRAARGAVRLRAIAAFACFIVACSLAFAPVAFADETASAQWKRLAGPTALDTMVQVVEEANFSTGGTVVLASAGDYWDALSAAGIAGIVDAPVLLTDGKKLSAQTEQLLCTLAPSKIVVCGGTDSISDAVARRAAEVAQAKEAPVRLSGKTAAQTAVAVLGGVGGITQETWASTALVCTGEGFWDALAAAPVAYHANLPIILTDGKGAIPDSAFPALKKQGIAQVYIVGGKESVSAAVETQLARAGFTVCGRLAGDNAVETSEKVAAFALDQCGMDARHLGVATTDTYHDALVGAALCGRQSSPIVLAAGERSHVVSDVGFIAANASSLSQCYLFGGMASISQGTQAAIEWACDPQAIEATRRIVDQLDAGERTASGGILYRQSEAALVDLPADATQVVIVHARLDNSCTIALHETVEGCWRQTYTSEGVVGAGGVGATREGISVTPAGVFALGFAFGAAANPGTTMEYRQLKGTEYWVDDPASSYYNEWVDVAYAAPDWQSAEHLSSSPVAYRYAVAIRYNADPTVPGAGSAFFLHCSTNGPSQGCVQTGENDMVQYLKRLHDGAHIAIFPA